MKKSKSQQIVKPRHRKWWNFANFVLAPIVDEKYKMKIEKFDDDKGQYFVLSNHQTPFDQFFITRLFKGPIYFVCTEDLLSIKGISPLIKHVVNPIPIQKGTLDISTIKTCATIAKQGGSVALYPEGNRTYSGKTCQIKPAVAKLAKLLKLPIAFARQEGGYGLEPRWADKIRKGKGRIYVKQVLEPEQYLKMTDDELYQEICQQLFVDESADGIVYKSNRRAEYIERAMFVCPHCGLSTFTSKRNVVKCNHCGVTVEYCPDKLLKPVVGEFPFTTMVEWYDYQYDFVNNLQLTDNQLPPPENQPLFVDKGKLSQVFALKCKKTVNKKTQIALFPDKIVIQYKKKMLTFHYDQVTGMAVMGRNKLNFHHDGNTYQVKGNKRFNALKYMMIYYRYKNIKENDNGTFLGI